MFSVTLLLVSLFYIISSANADQVRIAVNCDRNGFRCNTIGSKRQIIYQCPATTQDILVRLWSFNEPTYTQWIVIKNCDKVEINMVTGSSRTTFSSLTVENVTNLKFTRSIEQRKIPNKVILTNISRIEVIPENTFTVPHMAHYVGDPAFYEVQEIEFENVNIGTIESHAFNSLRGFRKFSWDNVNVDRMHSKAIRVAFNTTMKEKGVFSIRNSTIELMEYLSFQLSVKEATIENNKFVEIWSGGINGTIEIFDFINNVVNTLQPGAISILTKTANMIGNKFNYLKSGSLEKISPGLLVDSHTSFGDLEFTFKFSNNNVVYVDAGSLNPDMDAYMKVSTSFVYNFNTFLCTCANLGWLASSNGHGYSSVTLQDFYETIMESTESNICSGLDCVRRISEVKQKCTPNVTVVDFCLTTTVAPPTTSGKESGDIIWYNSTKFDFSSNNSIQFSSINCISSLGIILFVLLHSFKTNYFY